MKHIYLIRHGESIANTQGIYQGITYDTDLTDLGKKQAQALAERLGKIEIDYIISSPLKRTRQTAEAIGHQKKMQMKIEERIIETNHGLWEGKHKDVIAKIWPVVYKKWQRFPSSVTFPEGERFVETQKRVTAWWDELIAQNKEVRLVIVTHDNIIRILIARVLNMKLNRIWKFHLHPTGITHVETNNTKTKVVDLNNAQHLGQMQSDLEKHAL